MGFQAGIIGRFGLGKNLLNGQTVKTKMIANALYSALGDNNLLLSDTYGGAKALLRLPSQCVRAVWQCKNVIILPANKGIRIIAPFLFLLNIFFKRKLHYVVIGAWLANFLKTKPFLSWCLKGFDCIYSETTIMKQQLEKQGFKNVVLMPNFKKLPILQEVESHDSEASQCRLCTFSRVMAEKGIDTAVAAVCSANTQLNRTTYCLDIYGQVDIHQERWFAELQKTFPEYIRYCGDIPFDQSTSILCKYDALLFPTKYYTEGIPGTIIDAYAAGLPVIASKWENCADIIDDETGFVYDFDDPKGLEKVLWDLAQDKSMLTKMKSACLRKAHAFSQETIINILIKRLKGI